MNSAIRPTVHRRPFRVFVSYARTDDKEAKGGLIRWAREVVKACEGQMKEPIDVFVDTVGIEAGESFPEAIRLELEGADVLIALLSEGFPASHWCPKEIKDFLQTRSQRGLKDRNLMLVGIGGTGVEVLKQLSKLGGLGELESKQVALDIGAPFTERVTEAAAVLEEMMKPLPPRETKGFSMRRPTPPDWRGQEVFQYVSAFDSVRSQRDKSGMPQQTTMIDLRAKLAYLLGYTVVVSETQAFDSLGAIHTMAEASRAWVQQPGPVAPFRIAHFRKPKGHVVDIALAKFGEVERGKAFDFSAWRKHEKQRGVEKSAPTRLADAKLFAADWDHFLEAARFLSWFPCDRLAEMAPVPLDVYLHHLVATYSGRTTSVHAAAITDDIQQVMGQCRAPGNRTALYEVTDGMGWSSPKVEAVKDVIDVAYNRTVADSVLFAATSARQARSMSLTDPTPDQRAPVFDDVVRSLLGYRDITKGDSHGYARFQGAWEGRHDAIPANALSWADVFEITSEPQWMELREKVHRSRRLDASSNAWQESMMELSTWIQTQLAGNVFVDVTAGRIALRAHGFEAGVGSRLGSDLGVVGEGQA